MDSGQKGNKCEVDHAVPKIIKYGKKGKGKKKKKKLYTKILHLIQRHLDRTRLDVGC